MTESMTLHTDKKMKTTAMHTSVGGLYGSFGGSASMKKDSSNKISKRESMMKKYFFTSAYQVDNKLSFSEEAPPDLHPSFLADLVLWNTTQNSEQVPWELE